MKQTKKQTKILPSPSFRGTLIQFSHGKNFLQRKIVLHSSPDSKFCSAPTERFALLCSVVQNEVFSDQSCESWTSMRMVCKAICGGGNFLYIIYNNNHIYNFDKDEREMNDINY